MGVSTIRGKCTLGRGVHSLGVRKGVFEEGEMKGGKDLLDLSLVNTGYTAISLSFLPTKVVNMWCVLCWTNGRKLTN